MTTFLHCLSAELLKLRRTLALALTVLAPLVIAILMFAMYLQHPGYYLKQAGDAPWKQLGEMMLTYWSLLMLPLFITLESALLGHLEHSQKNWKLLFTLPAPRRAIYLAKLVVCQGLIAISTLVLLVFMVLLGQLLQAIEPAFGFGGAIPWGHLLWLGLLSYLASWFLIAFHLWISVRASSFVVAVAAGIAATIVGVFIFGQDLASVYPWTIPGTLSMDLAQEGITRWVSLAIGWLGCIPLVLAALWDLRRWNVH
jgi:lantibiotic transport system permease protein